MCPRGQARTKRVGDDRPPIEAALRRALAAVHERRDLRPPRRRAPASSCARTTSGTARRRSPVGSPGSASSGGGANRRGAGKSGQQRELAGKARIHDLAQAVAARPGLQTADEPGVARQVDRRPGPKVVMTWLRRTWPLRLSRLTGSRRKRLTLGSTSRSERLARNLRCCGGCPSPGRATRAAAASAAAGSSAGTGGRRPSSAIVVERSLLHSSSRSPIRRCTLARTLVALGRLGEAAARRRARGTTSTQAALELGAARRSISFGARAAASAAACRGGPGATSAPASPRSSARGENGVTLVASTRGRTSRGRAEPLVVRAVARLVDVQERHDQARASSVAADAAGGLDVLGARSSAARAPPSARAA